MKRIFLLLVFLIIGIGCFAQTPSPVQIINVNTNTHILNNTDFSGSNIKAKTVTSTNMYIVIDNTSNRVLTVIDQAQMNQNTTNTLTNFVQKISVAGTTNTPINGVVDLGLIKTQFTKTSLSSVLNYNKIYNPVIDISSPILVTSTQTIYKIAVNSPSSISNNLSALLFDGTKEARWEVWLDIQTTNALSITWNGIDFGGMKPDLTVTGLYKFAFSSCCGQKIQAKQIFPTIYEKRSQQTQTSANNLYGTFGGALFFSCASPSTNLYTTIRDFDNSQYQFLTYYANCNSSVDTTNLFVGYAVMGVYGKLGTPDYSNASTGFTSLAKSTYQYKWIIPPIKPTYGLYAGIEHSLIKIDFYRQVAIGIVYFWQPEIRLANELEINAYNAGWRP